MADGTAALPPFSVQLAEEEQGAQATQTQSDTSKEETQSGCAPSTSPSGSQFLSAKVDPFGDRVHMLIITLKKNS
jgi:hypothetical protein